LRIAVLDDYQQAALTCADWGVLGAKIVIFDRHIAQTAELAAKLAPFDVIVAMRERTPFTADRLGLLPTCGCSSPPGCGTRPSTSPPRLGRA
jgi:hypothetical protein